MLRLRSLGSGSTGNATLVEGGPPSRPVRLLVDCGFGLRQLQARLARAGLTPDAIDAIFITHEHGDHVGCAVALAQTHGIALWMSTGTHAAIGAPALGDLLHLTADGGQIDLGAFRARPFTVPHDAREPLQLTCDDGDRCVGVVTDLGHATQHVVQALARCHALLLEFNHDPGLLAAGNYPAFLKARVGGMHGHLANEAAAELLARVCHGGLHTVVAAHLSQQNNSPDLARAAMNQGLAGHAAATLVASHDLGTGWIEA